MHTQSCRHGLPPRCLRRPLPFDVQGRVSSPSPLQAHRVAMTCTASQSSATPRSPHVLPMPAPPRADVPTPLTETLLGTKKRTTVVSSSTWLHSPRLFPPQRHVGNGSRSDSPRCPISRPLVIGDSASRPRCPASVSHSPPFAFNPFRLVLPPSKPPLPSRRLIRFDSSVFFST